MAQGPMERAMMIDPMSKLTDDILTDIISRVPYKSTCCCKCVSTRWRDLFSHPDYRKKMPHSIAGFFYKQYPEDELAPTTRCFTNVSGKDYHLIDTSLSFLPKYENLDILDCCNGLLLCRCWKETDCKTLDYVVCNPATEKWVVVPATDWSSQVEVARLGFEPAVSSHFHVFEFIDEDLWGLDESNLNDFDRRIAAVATYSSKAGVWTHQMVEDNDFAIASHSKGVFFNGIMHLAALDDMVVTFDVEGNVLRTIGTPSPPYRQRDYLPVNDVFLSQGQLHFTCSIDSESDSVSKTSTDSESDSVSKASTDSEAGSVSKTSTDSESDSVCKTSSESDSSDLLVWVLEDYSSEEWTLKHTVSYLQLFRNIYSADRYYNVVSFHYNVVSFHPERNMIFIVCGHKNTLMSYEMDCMKQRILRELGWDNHDAYLAYEEKNPFIPYVPLFMESLADGP